MQLKETIAIAAQWEERKKKHPNLKCDHTEADLKKEYDLGTATGDYVCPKCGAAFWERKIPDGEK